jgi:hypothetical protein
VVEHIFALAVGLEIGGSGRDQPAFLLDQDRRGRPAGAAADAVRILQRREEGVAEERVAAGEPVPRRRIEAADARGELGDDYRFAVGHTANVGKPLKMN